MIKFFLFIVTSVVLFTGCNSSKTYVENEYIIEKNAKKYQIKEIDRISEPILTPQEYKKMLEAQNSTQEDETVNMNEALMDVYNEWKGVKYKFGGNSKRGIDCSAFTQKIFKEKFDITIPRTTRTQVNIGKKIKKSELAIGDLVFFKTGKQDRHVGIYMGNGDFLHASIKGVKFTKLNKPFYRKHYWTSRRIIQD